jgi:hypothetical protein
MTGRKILIDTNVFIGLEDQKEIAPEFAKMVHTLAHPLLDGAEGVLDGLTAPGEDVRPGLQSVVER